MLKLTLTYELIDTWELDQDRGVNTFKKIYFEAHGKERG